MKVYFMYSFADKDEAYEKIEELRNNKLDVFAFNADEKYVGRAWRRLAAEKIKECNFVCYYFNSSTYLKSKKNIAWEYRTAQKFNKKVIFIDGGKQHPEISKLIEDENKDIFKKLFNESYSEKKLEVKLDTFEEAQALLYAKSNWNAYGSVIQTDLINCVGHGEFYSLLMQQYKIMIDTSESLINRRQTTSNVYVGILTALISLVGSSLALPNKLATGIIFFIVGIITIILSVNWKNLLINYDKNNEGKFVVINAIEKRLPANMFDTEYNYNKLKSIASYSTREMVLCNIFMFIGGLISIAGVTVLILKLLNII